MQDEEQAKNQNEEELEAELDESTSEGNLENEEMDEEESNEQETEDEEDEESEESGETDSEEDEELSPRQKKRVEQIEELKLNKILDRVTKGSEKPSKKSSEDYKPLDYEASLDADKDIIEKLKKDRDEYGRRQSNEALEEIESAQFRMRLEIDAPKVAQRHKFLDNEDPNNFDPAAADAINRMYLTTVGFNPETGKVQNPSLRYAEFVDAFVELVDKTAQAKTIKARQNITKQAARTGLRPSGKDSGPVKISSPEDISKISPKEWEKNRDMYLKQLGITRR